MQTHCPHCRNPIDLAGATELSNVVCPTCGSTFSLLGDETVSVQKYQRRRIGHFELLNQVGVGAFGSVWKARDTKLDRIVAIKLPRSEQMNAREVAQFLREARAAAQLNHPNIVRVHEVGRDEGQTYIVSEFIDGVALSSWLTSRYPAFDECVEFCVKIADALSHAHANDVVHRDLKPSNVLIDGRNQPYLTDFGLAKRSVGEVTMTVEGKILGTPAYMSPEQARGDAHQADERSDLYSLGVMFFQLITHELPFRGDMRMLLHQVINDDPPSPRNLRKSIPQDLETICLKLLEKEPRLRYQSAKEVFDELQRYKSGESIHARPINGLQRVWRWCNRNPALAGLIVSISVALIAITVLVSGLTYRRNLETALTNEQAARLALEESQRTVNELLYVQRVARAHAEFNAGRLASADRFLNACPEADRDWEWRYVYNLCHAETLSVETGQRITGVAYNERRNRILTGQQDGSITIWNLMTGEVLRKLREQDDRIRDIKISPGGLYFATASADGTAAIWDTAAGNLLRKIHGHEEQITGLDFGEDPQMLVTGGWEGVASIWEVADGSIVRSLIGGHSGKPIKDVALSPDDKRVATAGWDGTAMTWDVATGQPLTTFVGHTEGLIRILFSPDGKKLISASEDTTAKIWDATSGRELMNLVGHTDAILGLAVSPDASLVATASEDTTVKIWSLHTGDLQRTIPAHGDQVSDVEFSDDGTQILTGGWDGYSKVWNVKSPLNGVVLKAEDYLVRVAFVDGNRDSFIAVTRGGDVIKWDSGIVTPLFAFEGNRHFLSPDGSRGVVCRHDGNVVLVNLLTGEVISKLLGKLERVVDVAFSNDSEMLAIALNDRSPRIFDQDGHQIARLEGAGDIVSLCFAAESNSLAGVAKDGIVTWETTSWKPVRFIPVNGERLSDIAFAPQGDRVAIGKGRGQISVVELESGTEIASWKAHISSIAALAFISGGKRLITSGDDATITVWNPDNGLAVFRLDGHVDGVRDIAVSDDEEWILSASEDRTIRLWATADN